MVEDQSSRAVPFGILAAILTVVLLGVAYGVARGGLDFWIQVLSISTLLVVLAIVAFFGARAGRGALFVAIALLLPYALAASWAYGSAQRFTSTVDELFGSDPTMIDEPLEDWSEEPLLEEDFPDLTPNPDATGADANGDGIPDDAYEGLICSAETSGEVQTCVMNGGGVD